MQHLCVMPSQAQFSSQMYCVPHRVPVGHKKLLLTEASLRKADSPTPRIHNFLAHKSRYVQSKKNCTHMFSQPWQQCRRQSAGCHPSSSSSSSQQHIADLKQIWFNKYLHICEWSYHNISYFRFKRSQFLVSITRCWTSLEYWSHVIDDNPHSTSGWSGNVRWIMAIVRNENVTRITNENVTIVTNEIVTRVTIEVHP